jgi:hypothetical protein
MKKDPAYAMKHDAQIQLSSWEYLMYCEMVDESLFYNLTVVDGGHAIQRVGSDAPPRILLTGHRCNCASVQAFNGFQCPHEIARDKKFRKELFDPFWNCMAKIGHSTSDRSIYEPEDSSSSTMLQNNEDTNIPCDPEVATGSDIEGCQLSQSGSEFSQQRDKRTNKRYANYGALQELASELVEACANNTEVTHDVAGVLSYVLEAVKSNNMESMTKEQTLSRFLLRYSGVPGGRCGDMYNPTGPNMRTVPGPGRQSKGHLKSTAEKISLQTKKKAGRGLPMSQIEVIPHLEQTPNTYPDLEPMAAAKKKRSSTFCGDLSHARWDACLSKGRAACIGGRCVEATQSSYREFHDQLANVGYYIIHKMTQENGGF